MTARIGLFTAQILLGLLLSVGFSCSPVTPGRRVTRFHRGFRGCV
jgi:hypothetical protein